MSVIVWDGKTLAADRRGNSGGLIFSITKIKKIRGHLVGVCSDASAGSALMHWFESGADAKDWPDCQKDKDRWSHLLVICPEKRIICYEQDPYYFEIEQDKYALGSGRDFAIAAMDMGMDAKQAVLLASKFSSGCGNGVDELSHD